MNNKLTEMTIPLMIIYIVFDYFGIDAMLRTSKTRKREVVQARQVAMYYMGKYTKFSQSGIGSYFQKDHATVIHSFKTVNNMIDTDRHFKSDIERINNRIISRIEIDDHKYDQYDTDRV